MSHGRNMKSGILKLLLYPREKFSEIFVMNNLETASTEQVGSHDSILLRLLYVRLILSVIAAVCWLAIDGFATRFGSELLLFAASLIFVGHSIWLYRRIQTKNTDSNDLMIHIVVDSVVLFAVIFATGGTANPFVYYLIVLVAISATVLRRRAASLFCLGTIVSYTALFFFDMKDHFEHLPRGFQLHLAGMWLNFVGSAILISFFISRLAAALRDQQAQLAKAREETLKAEQLVGIGTLAASTMHSLATPLSTLSIMLEELRASQSAGIANEEFVIMSSQIERCKQTMQKLALLAEHNENARESEPVDSLASDLSEHYAIMQPLHRPSFVRDASIRSHRIVYSVLLRHALINLADNAIRASRTLVQVRFSCTSDHLQIDIEDDGAGLPDELANNWGKPVSASKASGLGIGIFLANSTIERLGGTVQLSRYHDVRSGEMTRVRVSIPLITSM